MQFFDFSKNRWFQIFEESVSKNCQFWVFKNKSKSKNLCWFWVFQNPHKVLVHPHLRPVTRTGGYWFSLALPTGL
jgi:hypothetical protein